MTEMKIETSDVIGMLTDSSGRPVVLRLSAVEAVVAVDGGEAECEVHLRNGSRLLVGASSDAVWNTIRDMIKLVMSPRRTW